MLAGVGAEATGRVALQPVRRSATARKTVRVIRDDVTMGTLRFRYNEYCSISSAFAVQRNGCRALEHINTCDSRARRFHGLLAGDLNLVYEADSWRGGRRRPRRNVVNTAGASGHEKQCAVSDHQDSLRES